MMKIHEATRTIVAGTYGLSTYKANLNNLYTGVEKKTGAVTGRISCSPNPVSNSTMLRFYLPSGGVYEIGVYDIEGKFIGKILSDRFPRGEQSVLWTSGKPFPVTPGVLATGTYIIRISGDNFSATTKLIRL
jgi:hypothetical protein